jgi:hypothetical protein
MPHGAPATRHPPLAVFCCPTQSGSCWLLILLLMRCELAVTEANFEYNNQGVCGGPRSVRGGPSPAAAVWYEVRLLLTGRRDHHVTKGRSSVYCWGDCIAPSIKERKIVLVFVGGHLTRRATPPPASDQKSDDTATSINFCWPRPVPVAYHRLYENHLQPME